MCCKLSLGDGESSLRVCQFCIRFPKHHCSSAVHISASGKISCSVLLHQAPKQPAYRQTSTGRSAGQGSPVKFVSKTLNSLSFECKIFVGALQSRLQLLHTSFKAFCLHLHHDTCPVNAAKLDCGPEDHRLGTPCAACTGTSLLVYHFKKRSVLQVLLTPKTCFRVSNWHNLQSSPLHTKFTPSSDVEIMSSR